MWYVWHNWTRVTQFYLVGILVAGVLAWLWAYVRVRRGLPARYAFAEAMMIAGTAPWAGPLLTPDPSVLAVRKVFLVPFRDLSEQVAGGPRYLFVEVGGNLAVLAVLGFFMPIRYRVGLVAVAGTAAAVSGSVETAQYVLDLHRVTSIDDVTLNTAGALLGAVASRRYWRIRRLRRNATSTAVPGVDLARSPRADGPGA